VGPHTPEPPASPSPEPAFSPVEEEEEERKSRTPTPSPPPPPTRSGSSACYIIFHPGSFSGFLGGREKQFFRTNMLRFFVTSKNRVSRYLIYAGSYTLR
jgi:hypothetical protein